MRLGVAYPQTELGGRRESLREFGLAAERLGYDHLLIFDHILGAVHGVDRDPPLFERAYTERDPFHDPFVALSYLSAITTRIEFVTGVLVLPQRQTVLVARQAADLSILSEGRLRLGVGIGQNSVEYDALGMSFRNRGQRIEEQIRLLRLLWNGDPLRFDGEFDHVDRAALCPAPSGKIPIYYGGSSEAALSRAARLADGFIFSFGLGDDAVEAWRRVGELLDAESRPRSEFRTIFNLIPRAAGTADVDGVLRWLERLDRLGVDAATLSSARFGLASLPAHLDFIETVRRRADSVVDWPDADPA